MRANNELRNFKPKEMVALLFLVASIIFFAGCLFLLPEATNNKIAFAVIAIIFGALSHCEFHRGVYY